MILIIEGGDLMYDIVDEFTIDFQRLDNGELGVCVRKKEDMFAVLKIEIGEQAEILHRLLTDQTTKGMLKEEGD